MNKLNKLPQKRTLSRFNFKQTQVKLNSIMDDTTTTGDPTSITSLTTTHIFQK